MAGFSPNDIKVVADHEEAGLKQVIGEAWITMKRTNWDDTKFCTINPNVVLTFSQAKSFQSFYENEGWFVQIKRANRNYYFDVYRSFDQF
ncbi:MAG TPA: hypothetical protein PK358_14570 [Spirochaetota bacterium]|nr:hypothetical protein [Spirochaetota bacterium]HPJ36060.1 hypothetical protein [Spirochaetota bacterium]